MPSKITGKLRSLSYLTQSQIIALVAWILNNLDRTIHDPDINQVRDHRRNDRTIEKPSPGSL